jgi:DNA-binding transcriptional ArsR family regulator
VTAAGVEAKPVKCSWETEVVTAGMEKALWYLLVGTRGGKNRVRLVRALSERPRNANQLADELELDYNTVRYHLDKLLDHDVVERSEDDYGELYFLTDRFEQNRDQFETIVDQME